MKITKKYWKYSSRGRAVGRGRERPQTRYLYLNRTRTHPKLVKRWAWPPSFTTISFGLVGHHCRDIIRNEAKCQGWPLTDWTDCFQSGPTPKGAPWYACHQPTQTYTFYWSCLCSAACGPQFFKHGTCCQHMS